MDYYRADYPPIGPAVNDYDYQFYFVFLRESIVDNMFDVRIIILIGPPNLIIHRVQKGGGCVCAYNQGPP